MTTFVNYTIRDGDNLESISDQTLGTPARWLEIAVLNKLRAPFISNEPIDQYGVAITQGSLTSALAADARSYTFQPSELPVSASVYAAGCIFFVQYWEYVDATTFQATKYDAMALASAVDETTGALTFTPSADLYLTQAVTLGTSAQPVTVTNTKGLLKGVKLTVDVGGNAEVVTLTEAPIAGVLTITAVFTKSHVAGTQASYGVQHAYPLGTAFYLFSPRSSLGTRVLRTGDVLHIPDAGLQAGSVGSLGSAFADYLGADLRLDPQGLVVFRDDGALQTVTGMANVAQAIELRLSTPLRNLVHSPHYGNGLWDHVGDSPHFEALARGLVTQAILSDPRVESIETVEVTRSGAALRVDAGIRVRGGSTLVRIDNLILRV